MITVTDRAVQAIRDCIAAEKKSMDSAVLRVAVKGGGCSGFMYDLTIDEATTESDTIIQNQDVRIAVDKKSKLFLLGMTLDYTSGLNGKGFVFSNPNAKATCGCGESFTV
jgi:iron-sulfur cluster assembly protein